MFTEVVERLRTSFKSRKTRSVTWRKNQLQCFLRMLDENKDALCQAIWKDLHKNYVEADLMEFAQVRNELVEMIENLDKRADVVSCSKKALSVLNKVHVRKEPFGVVLVIGAWNYPLLLTLQPMIGAIAAGNCVIVKPSELSAATANIIQELVPKYLDNDCYSVIVAEAKESSELINNNKFDLILYTGGSHVARYIMQAAAMTLTPVILELGGKNPCYVDKSCDLESTARRIAWGKWTNCGQICVAPDYILCEAGMMVPLVEKLKEFITEYYGENPRKSDSYGRIVHERHVKRLEGLLKGVDIVHGGVFDETERYFSPTIVVNVKEDAPIRQEEVFGPILPIFIIKSIDDAIEYVNLGEKSLQMSVFGEDKTVVNRFIRETSSGGVTVNELLMQHNELDLPFGGVGCSGMGYYHGKYSYDSFCNLRSYFESHTPELLVNLRYPPYTEKKLAILSKVLTEKQSVMPKSIRPVLRLLILATLGVAIAYLFNLFDK